MEHEPFQALIALDPLVPVPGTHFSWMVFIVACCALCYTCILSLSLPDNTMAAKWLATRSQQQSTGSWDHQYMCGWTHCWRCSSVHIGRDGGRTNHCRTSCWPYLASQHPGSYTLSRSLSKEIHIHVIHKHTSLRHMCTCAMCSVHATVLSSSPPQCVGIGYTCTCMSFSFQWTSQSLWITCSKWGMC